MLLLTREFTDATRSFNQFWAAFNTSENFPAPGSRKDEIASVVNVRAVTKAATSKGIEVLSAFDFLKLSGPAQGSPAAFMHFASQLVMKHTDRKLGELQFIDIPPFGDLRCPTVDRLDLTITLGGDPGYKDKWIITVDGWVRKRLTLLINTQDAWWALQNAGFDVNYGTETCLEVRRPYQRDLTNDTWRPAMQAQCEQLAALILPSLRVRKPKQCQFKYKF